MKLLVIGSTGRTGKHVVEQAIQRGHEVTAFSRRPEQLNGIQGIKNIIHGDGLNLEDIRKAVQGQDAVISAIGSSGIAANLITAMPEAGVRRVVMTSSLSVVATRPWLPITLIWLVLREAYADLARAEGMLQASGLDWSIVRATMLNDKPYSGQVHIDFNHNVTGGDWSLGRADYAMTLLNVVEDPKMIHKTPGVVGVKASRKTAAQAA